MLKTLEWVAITATVVLILSMVGVSYLSSPPSGYPRDQQATTQSAHKEQTEEKHSLRGFIRFLFPDGIAVFTFWLVLATVGLGIIAVVQIGFLKTAEEIADKSANAAKDAADAARDQIKLSRELFVADQRPWMSLDVQIMGPLAYDDTRWQGGTRWHVPLNYQIKHLGKSPATDVDFFAKIIPFILPHWPDEKIEIAKPEGPPIPGTDLAKEFEEVCGFPEALAINKMGGGRLILPTEAFDREQFGLNGNPALFEEAKKNRGYVGQFIVIACATYGSTLSDARYRIGKAFVLYKKSGTGKIDLSGEAIPFDDLGFVLHPQGGTYSR